MSKKPYIPGEHKVQCDICGRVRRNNQMRMQWDNLLVCADRCWSPKHPNEIPRPVINDGLPVPNARPRPTTDNMTQITIQGTTRWEDTGLRWDIIGWTWTDDLSTVPLDDLLTNFSNN